METCVKRSFETANAPVRLRWAGGTAERIAPPKLLNKKRPRHKWPSQLTHCLLYSRKKTYESALT